MTYKNKQLRNQGISLTRLEGMILIIGYVIASTYMTYLLITAMAADYIVNNGGL